MRALSRRAGLVLALPAILAILMSGRGLHADSGVTPAEIVLGERSAFSGPSAGLGIEVWRGESAAFAEANDDGGVHGRKIRLVLADDGYDPARALKAAQQLVSGDKIFALFGGVGTPTLVNVLPLVLRLHDREGLFQFANFTGAQAQREPPYDRAVFNVRAAYRQEIRAMVNAFLGMGRRQIGVFAQDDAYGQSGRDAVKRALNEHGLLPVAEVTYMRGQSFGQDNREAMRRLREAGASAVIAVGAYQACAGFIRDVREAGWDVPIHNVSFVGADQMLGLLHDYEKRTGKQVTGSLITTQVVPSYSDLTIPLVRRYRAAMDRYRPTVPAGIGDGSYTPAQPYSFGSLEGYLDAQVFLAILRQAGPTLTRASFRQAAEHMGDFDVGLGVPCSLSPSRHQVLDKVWFTHATATGWSPNLVTY